MFLCMLVCAKMTVDLIKQSVDKAIKFHSTKYDPNTHPTIFHKKPIVRYAFFVSIPSDMTTMKPCNKVKVTIPATR